MKLNENIFIKQGDSLQIIKSLPNEYVDLIITDPPYGIDYQSNYKKEKFDKLENDDNLNWFQEFSDQSFRILKNNSAIYCFTRADVYSTMFDAFIKSGFKFRNLIFCPKANVGGNGDLMSSFTTGHELILYFNKGRRKFEKTEILKPSEVYLNDKRKSPKEYLFRLPSLWHWCKSTEHNLKMQHPTQKSVEVFESMVQISSRQNDIILDPFAGVFASGIACLKNNRKYIGYELDEKYFEIGKNRLEERLKEM